MPQPNQLESQIKCVEEEIAMRERVYPRLVEQGKMTNRKAKVGIDTMKQVLSTLKDIYANQNPELL